MHVLVVGATGQIGTAVLVALSAPQIEALEELGVTALVRKRPPTAGAVAKGRQPVAFDVAPTFTEERFLHALDGATHVVYGVGLPEQFTYDPAVFERVNVGLLGTFFRALARHGESGGARPRLTYVSTYEVFQTHDGRIEETHPAADPASFASPYFRAMSRAYLFCLAEASRLRIPLTTIHPAAVYGGRDTGYGLTHYLHNLLGRRHAELPCIVPTVFPVVHAESLAGAVVRTLDEDGPFLVSDGMTSLEGMARELRALAPGSYVPPTVPVAVVRPAITGMEAAYRALHRLGLTDRPPPMSKAQLDFLTSGSEPTSARLIATTPWRPMPLRTGLERFLERYGAHGRR